MIDEKKLIADMEKLPFIHGRYDKKNANPHFISGVESMYEMIKELIKSQPKVGEWIPCSERLPENAKHKGAFCPKYQVKTKYGITEGWYNLDTESWYCLFWFLVGRYDETDIDFEKGDKPKVIRVPDGTGIVVAWKEPSEPWEGGKE